MWFREAGKNVGSCVNVAVTVNVNVNVAIPVNVAVNITDSQSTFWNPDGGYNRAHRRLPICCQIDFKRYIINVNFKMEIVDYT